MPLPRRTSKEGLVVGLIAYAAVVVFYAAFDLIAGRGTLYTVDVLGRALFQGLRDPALLLPPLQPDLNAIFAYNAFHLVMSLAIGLVVVRLVDQAVRQTEKSHRYMFMIVTGFVGTIFAVGLLSRGMRPVLPWWSIVAANWLAMMLAGAYLIGRRRQLWRPFVPSVD